MTDQGWTADSSLYAGAAAFYPLGRVAYPPELADRLAAALHLDGSGRLLDVGCGPGSLTLLIAPLFAEAIGVDADAAMLAEAARQAARGGITIVSWRNVRGEQLPAGIRSPTLVTFAQSFHWMDRRRVAGLVRQMLAEGGAVVHVGATTHEGIDTDERLPLPRPPREAIRALIRQFLGDARRAGRSTLPNGETPDGEDAIYRAAGFRGPERLELPDRVVQRTAEEIRASIYSLSSSTPTCSARRSTTSTPASAHCSTRPRPRVRSANVCAASASASGGESAGVSTTPSFCLRDRTPTRPRRGS